MKKEKSTSKKTRLNYKTIGAQYWNQTIRAERLKEHYQINDKKLSQIIERFKNRQIPQPRPEVGIVFNLADYQKIIKFCQEHQIEHTIPAKFTAEYTRESKLNEKNQPIPKIYEQGGQAPE